MSYQMVCHRHTSHMITHYTSHISISIHVHVVVYMLFIGKEPALLEGWFVTSLMYNTHNCVQQLFT